MLIFQNFQTAVSYPGGAFSLQTCQYHYYEVNDHLEDIFKSIAAA